MTKLTYKSAADLIADFKAGAKFEVIDYGVQRPVTSIEADAIPGRFIVYTILGAASGTYFGFNLDGTSRMGSMFKLVKIADAPATIGKDGVFPLPFKTSQEIVEAFTRGAKFVVEHDGAQEKVTSLLKLGADNIRVFVPSRDFLSFRPNGSHLLGFKLIMTAAPSPSLAEQLKAKLMAPTAPATPKPFLQRVLNKESFHVPATREVLHSVDFLPGRIELWLVNEKGDMRCSTNYNHEGKHKWVAGRSLVPGALPPKPEPERKQVSVDIYRHASNGSLFVIREGEVIPSIRGYNNATKVGSTVIAEPVRK
ncbi:hypothetical protein QCE62_00090 [Caballeronia sp. LZ033]|uniref:hypothetical protein n=1 Tax=Caballeronia sp. LZ033 TaxID=3038566 RepID=UPI00285D848F|nr:hypothetical protein [Caballeronia sp. LZ033]MDR5811986.1 hypothetical protein [Caballeronia sp. LZ033]